MPEPSNETRADWAYTALEAFARETRQDLRGDLRYALDSVVGDLLCDLMHFCHQHQIDFHKCLQTGAFNFEAELEEEGGNTGGFDLPARQSHELLQRVKAFFEDMTELGMFDYMAGRSDLTHPDVMNALCDDVQAAVLRPA